MIVPRSRLAEVEELAARGGGVVHRRRSVRRRHAPRPADLLGPARAACAATSRRASTRAPTLVTGGADAPDGLDTGLLRASPTVFSNVTRDMTIAQEEIFGPVLSIIPYDTEEEAIEIANDTVYGLAGGVSGSDERAQAVAAQDPRRPGARQRGRRRSAARRSAATSSRASDASTASTGSRSSSR